MEVHVCTERKRRWRENMKLDKERGRGQGGREGEYGTREGERERTRREGGRIWN